MAKSNPVVVAAVNGFTDVQLRRLQHHTDRKTGILCGSNAARIVEDNGAALFVLASVKDIPSRRFSTLSAMPKTWRAAYARMTSAVPATELSDTLRTATQAEVRQSIRTVLKRRRMVPTA